MCINIDLRSVLSVYMLGACAFANTVCQKSPGALVCHQGETTVINTSGIFRAEGTHIKKKVSVKGQAIIKTAKINDMKIVGGLVLEDSSVLGQAVIYGFLNTRGSTFHKAMTIHGAYLKAESTQFEDVIVEGSEKIASVSLHDKSVVNGNIIFKGRPGIVTLGSQSKILGKIINGKQA